MSRPGEPRASQPRVSVVVPFLNNAPFLAEAIESVLAQTFEDWELLLVDDGSTDGSSDIARDYARRDPRIRCLHHPRRENRGSSASRNAALRKARGDLIALLDGDDVWLPNKLEEHVPRMDEHPDAGMLYGETLYWHGWTGSVEDAALDHTPALGVPPDTLVRDSQNLLLRQLQGEIPSPCPSSVLTRRRTALEVGGFEESFVGMHDDQVFYSRMMLQAPVFVAAGRLERYRQHAGSLTATARDRGEVIAHRLKYLAWLERELVTRGRSGSTIWRTVRAAQFKYRHPAIYTLRWRLRRLARALRRRRPLGRSESPRTGEVRLGDLRRTTPINRHWGWERGQPVDRFYIEQFLQRYAADVHGRTLEVGDDSYTRRFGGDRVTRRDILDVREANTDATIVADLSDADHIPSDAFDCIILTQTLHLIYDIRAALRTLHRILAPGGVLLVTAPGISQTTDDQWRDSWYWSLTVPSMRRLAAEAFPLQNLAVESHGNVLTAVAFLHGLAAGELTSDELAITDPDFPLVITLRARKSPGSAP